MVLLSWVYSMPKGHFLHALGGPFVVGGSSGQERGQRAEDRGSNWGLMAG